MRWKDEISAAHTRRLALVVGGIAATVLAVTGGLTTMARDGHDGVQCSTPPTFVTETTPSEGHHVRPPQGQVVPSIPPLPNRSNTNQTVPGRTGQCPGDELIVFVEPKPGVASSR